MPVAVVALGSVAGLSLGHVEGGSMTPHLEDGDVALVRRVDPASLRVGDVVIFGRDGQTIVHRIVERSAQADGTLVFTTKGDANPVADAPVPASQVNAKLVLAVPMLGGAFDSAIGFWRQWQAGVLVVAALVVAGVWRLREAP